MRLFLLLLLLVIPVQPLGGTLAGKPFVLVSSVFQYENIVLTDNTGRIVRIWAPWTDVPAGLTFAADKSSRVWDAPTVEVIEDGALVASYDCTSGYEIKMEFASVVNGVLLSRLALTLPDGSSLGGDFSLRL